MDFAPFCGLKDYKTKELERDVVNGSVNGGTNIQRVITVKIEMLKTNPRQPRKMPNLLYSTNLPVVIFTTRPLVKTTDGVHLQKSPKLFILFLLITEQMKNWWKKSKKSLSNYGVAYNLKKKNSCHL